MRRMYKSYISPEEKGKEALEVMCYQDYKAFWKIKPMSHIQKKLSSYSMHDI